MSRSISVSLCCLLALQAAALAQVPLTINGIADRATYTDTASFSVPVTAGYSYNVVLDGKRLPAVVTNVINKVDYHEVTAWRTNMSSGTVTNYTVRFIIQSSSRGNPEKGLTVWTPYPPIPSTAAELAGAQLHLVVPQDYPAGLDIPVAAWVDDGSDKIIRGNGWLAAVGLESAAFRILRGHGSGFLPAATTPGVINFDAAFTSLTAVKQINIESATAWTIVSGVLAENTVWPAHSRIALIGHLSIPAGRSLTIGAGSIVKINPLVNITNSGSLILEGSLDQPIVFTPTTRPAPERNTGAWGGIIMRGGHLVANGAILTGGGGATSFSFSPGASHRSEQALLLVHSGSSAFLTNCFLLNQAGQIMNGYNSQVVYDHCLLQRAITTGESVGSSIVVNHSAILEFPAIDSLYSSTIVNADYDGIYFTTGTHVIKDTLVGFAKDDAIDSGSGGAGTVLVTNCWIESALHEALAWSGGGRQTRTYDTVLINSGQGIEAAWTEGSAGSPDCFAERLFATANSVGARFGDNYDMAYSGFLRITNSLLLHNYRDVFAKTWNTSGSDWNTNRWVDRLAQMDLRSNLFTTVDLRFPDNASFNSGLDSSRIAPFMTTPAQAEVGIGLAVWTNQFSLSTLFEGVPVRLSSFTTRPVSVTCSFAGAAGQLASQTLTFQPGESVKRIFPAGFSLQDETSIRLTLSRPQNAEITGLAEVLFTGAVAAPVASMAVAAVQIDMDRLGEGVPLRLTAPAAHDVTVQYRFLAPNDLVLSSATATFQPGETLTWINPPELPPAEIDILRLDLLDITGATTTGPTNLFFIATESVDHPNPISLISYGAVWKYLDDGSDQGTAWREPLFPDAAWASGSGQLGFGEQDETTTIRRTDQIAGTNIITFYFRSAFMLAGTSNVADLTLSLLRDDGAVVYLNGKETFRCPNMPLGPIFYNTFASELGENSVEIVTLPATNLVAGVNVTAVEVHQRNADSSDLSFDCQLVANPIPAPSLPQRLRAGLFDHQLTLAWESSAYELQQASSITGAWSQVTSPSPISVPLTNNQMFYRLRR